MHGFLEMAGAGGAVKNKDSLGGDILGKDEIPGVTLEGDGHTSYLPHQKNHCPTTALSPFL